MEKTEFYERSMKYTYTTQAQVRDAFWEAHYVDGRPLRFRGKSRNELPADVRATFVSYVDSLQKEGHISEDLASRVSL